MERPEQTHPSQTEKEPRTTAVELVRPDLRDADEIASVFMAARRGMAYLPESPYSKEQTTDFFRGLLAKPDNTVLVAVTDDGSIAGFGLFGEGRLDHLYVRPSSQGQGIGTRLLEAAQARFSHLEGWVFEQNTRAIRLYERRGFKVVERTDGARNEEREPDVRIVWRRS